MPKTVCPGCGEVRWQAHCPSKCGWVRCGTCRILLEVQSGRWSRPGPEMRR